MKNELLEVKEIMMDYSEAKEEFCHQRLFFDFKVEEKIKQDNLNIECYGNQDFYDQACTYFDEYPFSVADVVEKIKKEHPKYQEKHLKELTLSTILSKYNNDEEYVDFIVKSVDEYYLYVGCGFFAVKELEDGLGKYEEKIKETVGSIAGESKEFVQRIKETAAEKIKPYGEAAQEEFGDFIDLAKGAVHAGSKKLVKFFDKIAKKTANDDDESEG